MKKLLLTLSFFVALAIGHNAHANAYDTYTVKSGDTMWKIAVKYQMGVSEIINANPQVTNPNLIYPNQKLNVPVKSSQDTSVENEVLSLVNNERSKQGLRPLTLNWELSRVAKIKSQDMSNNRYFSHQSPTYGSPFDMMQNFGITYRTAGENIAMGQTNATQVMRDWMNSSGHRANILNRNFTELGVGKYGTYWTQQFIGK